MSRGISYFIENLDKVSELCNIKNMNESDINRLQITAEVFKALGHPDRLALLEKLSEKQWCVCDLAAHLKLNKSVVSKHLTLLYTVGLLKQEKKGTLVLYSLTVPCILEMGKCGYLGIVEERRKRLS